MGQFMNNQHHINKEILNSCCIFSLLKIHQRELCGSIISHACFDLDMQMTIFLFLFCFSYRLSDLYMLHNCYSQWKSYKLHDKISIAPLTNSVLYDIKVKCSHTCKESCCIIYIYIDICVCMWRMIFVETNIRFFRLCQIRYASFVSSFFFYYLKSLFDK